MSSDNKTYQNVCECRHSKSVHPTSCYHYYGRKEGFCKCMKYKPSVNQACTYELELLDIEGKWCFCVTQTIDKDWEIIGDGIYYDVDSEITYRIKPSVNVGCPNFICGMKDKEGNTQICRECKRKDKPQNTPQEDPSVVTDSTGETLSSKRVVFEGSVLFVNPFEDVYYNEGWVKQFIKDLDYWIENIGRHTLITGDTFMKVLKQKAGPKLTGEIS